MGEEVLPSYLRSKLSSILDEAEADDGGSPTHIISRLRSIQTRIESMFANSWPMMMIIPVDLLYELIGLVSECRVFSFERRTAAVSKKGFGFYFPKLLRHPPFSEFMFNNKMRRRLDIIERKIGDCTAIHPPPAPIIEETRPIEDTSLIIGFEAEADKIEAWLMRKQEEEAPLRVVGIVGGCGCGKTALAQKVFASPIVKKEFSPMIWVSLSNMLLDDDRKVRVVNYILKEIGRHDDDRGVSNSDHSRLAEELQGKRYLIVLDNAWRLDEWYEELFSHALPGGGAVIVTSRREDVIRRMVVGSDDDKHVIRLQPHLSDEICWQIFSKVLQQKRKMYLSNTKLSLIQDDVKRNIDGLLLAAKTLADILPDLLLKMTYWVRARDLRIRNGDDFYWRWTFLPPPQEMEEVAELVAQVPSICIEGRVELKELVMKTSYSAYLVFKLKTKDRLNKEAVAFMRIVNERNGQVEYKEERRGVNLATEGMQRKGEEEQGWMEINLAHHIFTSNYLGHDDGDGRFFEAGFIDDKPDAYLKSRLVVKGIEFRAH